MKNLTIAAGKAILSVDAGCYQKGLSVACVIVGFHERSPRVLLTKFSGSDKWMLPTSLLMKTESPEDAAYRLLEENTGLQQINMQQFRLFGDNDRLTSDEVDVIMNLHGIEETKNTNRLVTLGYYALVDMTKAVLNTESNTEMCWFSLKELPELFGDDRHIAQAAFTEIRKYGLTRPIERDILPNYFTIEELKDVYEMVFQKDLDARNFERKILTKGYILKSKGHSDIGKARLFYFNQKNFERRADVIFWY